MKNIQYQDFQNCIQLTNGDVEIVVTTDFGPRIIAYNLTGGENILGIHADAEIETALGLWKPYGGHRLWIAPENMPNSYAPDNQPVEFFYDENKNSIKLTQPIEIVTNTQKEIVVTLDEKGSGVKVKHKITNLGDSETELSVWALTIMRAGGEVLIPNEDYAPYSAETLLPVRNLTVWSYTDLSDSRWHFDREYIRLRVDENKPDAQKIGVLNKKGWLKYRTKDVEFTKKIRFDETAVYPDMNSNTEIYVAGNFVETETLSPLCKLKKGEFAEHTEFWELQRINE